MLINCKGRQNFENNLKHLSGVEMRSSQKSSDMIATSVALVAKRDGATAPRRKI
jgi:hypothetical protein